MKMSEIRIIETTDGRYINEQDVMAVLEQAHRTYPTWAGARLLCAFKALRESYNKWVVQSWEQHLSAICPLSDSK